VDPGRLSVRVLDRPEQHDAGVVDHDVQASQLVDGPRDQRPHLLLVGDVGLDGQRAAASPLDLRGERVEPVGAARRDRDGGAAGRELPSGRLPDPLLAPVTSATVLSSRSVIGAACPIEAGLIRAGRWAGLWWWGGA